MIGRGFSYGLFRALAGMEDSTLQAALEQLAEADILFVQGLPPDSDYRFYAEVLGSEGIRGHGGSPK